MIVLVWMCTQLICIWSWYLWCDAKAEWILHVTDLLSFLCSDTGHHDHVTVLLAAVQHLPHPVCKGNNRSQCEDNCGKVRLCVVWNELFYFQRQSSLFLNSVFAQYVCSLSVLDSSLAHDGLFTLNPKCLAWKYTAFIFCFCKKKSLYTSKETCLSNVQISSYSIWGFRWQILKLLHVVACKILYLVKSVSLTVWYFVK